MTDYVLKDSLFTLNVKVRRALQESKDRQHKKRIEHDLKEALDGLNKIMASSLDIICTVDKDGRFVTVSSASEHIIGYHPQELRGKKYIDLVFKDDVESSARIAAEVMSGVSITIFENRYMHKNWNLVPVLWSATWNAGDNLMYCIGKDATQRKMADDKLKELNEDLVKRTKALAISNAELEQFAYIASHDLQEPLRMVTSYLTLIEKKYGDLLDEKGRKYIYFAVDGARRMRNIILDLLEYSRIGRADEHTELIDLNEMILGIEILFKSQIAEKEAVIRVDRLPEIDAHEIPTRQIFQNLISNALKYSRNLIPPQIHIRAERVGGGWQFSVTDNGIGIGREYFNKIFIIFQRLHNKDEYSGTGMGLAITKKIIGNQGGKIWLESEIDKGTTFYFTLPKDKD